MIIFNNIDRKLKNNKLNNREQFKFLIPMFLPSITHYYQLILSNL
jgi:hypothetical protein